MGGQLLLPELIRLLRTLTAQALRIENGAILSGEVTQLSTLESAHPFP